MATLLGAVTILVTASPARACLCVMQTEDEHLQQADVAFVGRAVGSQTVPNNGSGPALWLFEVDEVVKGDVHARQGVVSQEQSASCGLDVEKGRAYLVFARGGPRSDERRVEGAFYADKCEGTRPMDGEGPVFDGVTTRPPLPGGSGLTMRATLYDRASSAADEPLAWAGLILMLSMVGGSVILLARRRVAR